ncbi:acrylate utilization transcriptional regulator AcuR [Ideonella dechloratans]|uniref:acrylate utilization transcriptional regulator AcuR n=1 Tax=Ideonella dechloratans TaxID=36863 RepID=UPI0035AEC632
MSSNTVSPPPRRRGRPPKGRDESQPDTRTLLIRTGVAVLTEKGYSAVGLDEVLRLAQVPKGSFYHCFDSKEAFGQALIEAYAAYFAAKLDRCFDDATRPPLQRLQHFVAEAQAGMARHGFRRGCLVGNLGQEMGALPESFRQQLGEVFQDWQARTAACLAAAQQAGEVSSRWDSAWLAEFFWIGWEGAVLRAKLERSAQPLQAFAEGFFALLRSTP